jgi:transcriptional regulator with XRE-family HTH domain
LVPSAIVDGGLLIREARRRGHLTQRQLAERLGTSHGAVARWEKGTVTPSWDAVVAAVRAAGLDLRIGLVEADDHDLALIRGRLLRSPKERLADLAAMAGFIERGRRAAAPPA